MGWMGGVMDCTGIMEKISTRTKREVTLMCDAPASSDDSRRWVAVCDATARARQPQARGMAALVFGKGATPDRALIALLRQLELEDHVG